jgi:UPF0716 protein FxsA
MYLLLAFLLLPIVEITLFVLVGDAIGLGATLALVILGAVVGTVLMRSQGLAALRRVQAALDRGELPVGEVLDAASVVMGGILLLLPGFFTDVLGILLLVPWVRHRLGRGLLAWLLRHGEIRVRAARAGGPRRSGPTIIEGEFEEVRTPASPDRRIPPRDVTPHAEPPDDPPRDSRWRPPGAGTGR